MTFKEDILIYEILDPRHGIKKYWQDWWSLNLVSAEPLPLMDLCRRVIRQQVSKPRIEQGYLDKLNLPKPIKDYLQYKDRRYIRYILICDVNFDGKI